jgi:hypothetical protein
MTDGTFVKELDARFARPCKISVNGREYLALPEASGYGIHTLPQPAPEFPVVNVGTLRGFVRYVLENRDKLVLEETLAVVDDEESVRLLGRSFGEFGQRHAFAEASLEKDEGFGFGRFVEQEAFIIGLQAAFVPTVELANLVRIAGAIKDENISQRNDDGVTQTVNVRTGVALVREIEVQPIHTLAPYRTFREVDQPASRFLLRIRKGHDGPTLALFEADGGPWKLAARAAIATYLNANLPTTVPVLS